MTGRKMNSSFPVLFCRLCPLLAGGLFAAVILAGCGSSFRDFNRAPEFSRVRADLGYDHGRHVSVYPPRPADSRYSLYRSNAVNFYRDPRAMNPGDVLTVLIAMNDSANLNNRSDLKRNSESNLNVGGHIGRVSRFGGKVDAGSKANARGDAQVQRRENIQLSIAAVVTGVLPNGNLIINGSQEVRVNYELRVLNIMGIVRPRDIAGNNTIDYDKIAEARISYGGRGRMSEIQQPPYGQQFLNRAFPF